MQLIFCSLQSLPKTMAGVLLAEAIPSFSSDLLRLVLKYLYWPPARSSTPKLRMSFGQHGLSASEALSACTCIASNPADGNIYIGESTRIKVFERDGKFVRSFALPTHDFRVVSSIAFDSDGQVGFCCCFVVCTSKTHHVVVADVRV